MNKLTSCVLLVYINIVSEYELNYVLFNFWLLNVNHISDFTIKPLFHNGIKL